MKPAAVADGVDGRAWSEALARHHRLVRAQLARFRGREVDTAHDGWLAIFLVAVGITGLQLKGVESWVTPVFNGSVLLLAVAVSNVAATQRVLARARSAVGWRRSVSAGSTPTQPPAGEQA